MTTINPFFGTTHNPGDHTRIAGGSSGGSAAAVTGRLVVAATGSDTGGSVRIPAALCGCVGLKPTFGLVDTTGLLGACPTFDHVGICALGGGRSAAARGDGRRRRRTAGESRRPTTWPRPAADVAGLRVGVPRGYLFDGAGTGRVASGGPRSIAAGAGAVVRDVALTVPATLYDTMFAPIAVSEIRRTYAADWAARPDAFSPDFAKVFAGPGHGCGGVPR